MQVTSIKARQYRDNLKPPHFAFILTISGMMQEKALLHNPWFIVPVPPFEPKQNFESHSIIQAAKHIRSTIVDARRPEVVKQILQQHKNVRRKPFRSTNWGRREPNIVVSSWSHLPLFGLSFPSCSLEGKTIHPVYAQCSVEVCPALRMFGITLDDVLLTWRSEQGFWIQGNLDERIWHSLHDVCASYLDDSMQ